MPRTSSLVAYVANDFSNNVSAYSIGAKTCLGAGFRVALRSGDQPLLSSRGSNGQVCLRGKQCQRQRLGLQNGAIREHKELCYARREQRNESLKVLLGGIERGLVSTLTTIGSITEDRALSDVEKVTHKHFGDEPQVP